MRESTQREKRTVFKGNVAKYCLEVEYWTVSQDAKKLQIRCGKRTVNVCSELIRES